MFDDLRRKDPELLAAPVYDAGQLNKKNRARISEILVRNWAHSGKIVVAYWYKCNGILIMLKRNATVKTAPQKWQENAADGSFDVVFTFEEKVFDMVIEDLHNRDHVLLKPVLVINLEVRDYHEEAAVGARLTLLLCQQLETTENWEDSIDEIVTNFERQHHRKLLYSISFY